MSKRRALQQELQRDEVAESIQQTIDNIKRYRVQLIAIVALIVAGFVITWSVRAHHEGILNDSNILLEKVLTQNYALYNASDDAARKKAFDELMTATGSLRETYPSTRLGREARFLQGSAYYSMGDYTKSLAAYKDYTEQSPSNEEKANGEISQAYALENGSFLLPKPKQVAQLDQALSHYDHAAGLAQGQVPYLYFYALLGKARILELTGKNQDAIKLYEQVMRERPAPLSAPKTDEKSGNDQMLQMVLNQLADQQNQLSFQTTAKLRLERLKATPTGPAQTTATATAPQPAAKPATKPGARPGAKLGARPGAKPAAKPKP